MRCTLAVIIGIEGFFFFHLLVNRTHSVCMPELGQCVRIMNQMTLFDQVRMLFLYCRHYLDTESEGKRLSWSKSAFFSPIDVDVGGSAEGKV